MNSRVIILHGGAGRWSEKRLEKARLMLLNIAEEAMRILVNKGALDAVEYAIRSMEKNEVFNAGRGSALNLLGEVEVDAGLMTSEGKIGAAASVKEVMHPITLARIVMENTNHVLLAGDGAKYLAKLYGLLVKPNELITEYSYNRWITAIREIFNYYETGSIKDDNIRYYLTDIFPHILKFVQKYPEIRHEISKKIGEQVSDTVGAVAFDGRKIVAGVSTGGIFLKWPGRIGDSPIIGAGIYASKKGGCVATGHGEKIMKSLLCLRVIEHLDELNAAEAAKIVLDKYEEEINIRAGVIVVDNMGNWGVYHTTSKFPVVVMTDNETILRDFWRQ